MSMMSRGADGVEEAVQREERGFVQELVEVPRTRDREMSKYCYVTRNKHGRKKNKKISRSREKE